MNNKEKRKKLWLITIKWGVISRPMRPEESLKHMLDIWVERGLVRVGTKQNVPGLPYHYSLYTTTWIFVV